MAAVVTTAATVMCSHGGSVVLSASQQKLTVAGQAALVDGDLSSATISGCTLSPSPSTTPCTATTSMLVGSAAKLTAGGKGALLETANGLTNSVPPGTWSVSSAGQTKLTAV